MCFICKQFYVTVTHKHDFYNSVFKMKHKLYTASGSVPDTYVVPLKSTKGHTYVRK